MGPILRPLLLTILLLAVANGTAAAATDAIDTIGDNCADGACGFDLLHVADSVEPDGTVHFTVQRDGARCNTMNWPAVEVQPFIQLMQPNATSPDQQELWTAAVWAASSTTHYVWSPPNSTGTDDEVALAATVTPTQVDVTVPASLVASLGGLPLRYWVGNACREFPSTPAWEQKDIAPDAGLFWLEAPLVDDDGGGDGNGGGDAGGDDGADDPALEEPDDGMPIDDEPIIEDEPTDEEWADAELEAELEAAAADPTEADAPRDRCSNLLGTQDEPPLGFVARGVRCLPRRLNGNQRSNRIVGNVLANVIAGFGGHDLLFGRAGNDTLRGGAGNDRLHGDAGADRLFGDAGADIVRGGPGRDLLTGGAGRDRLHGDAGNDTLRAVDRAGGDVVHGGPGRDTCHVDRGDIVIGCERVVRRR